MFRRERWARRKRFRFEMLWLDEQECSVIVQDSWNGDIISSSDYVRAVKVCGEELFA